MLLNEYVVAEVARLRREEALDQARRDALARVGNPRQAADTVVAEPGLLARLFRRRGVRRGAKPRMARP